MKLTAERLRELLHYDPETGVFRWRVDRSHNARAGDMAGCLCDSDYPRIAVDGCLYRAHRLAWFYMTGRWPEGQIDHINRMRDDNRWCNLREASHSENCRNGSGARVGKDGYIGVRSGRQGKE